ncbi:hypothetical protein [Mesorhizobium sp.]|uniref:hypothetical protein n=1 Tax=Mesorhizobium sp. TaxID=1871066 RepID=UPI00258862C4|nr:hypothetical protein [Mesorhizobium sp.]
MARSAKTDEGCWPERGGAKLEHPSSGRFAATFSHKGRRESARWRLARSAKTVEGCWTECGGAKLEHPSSGRSAATFSHKGRRESRAVRLMSQQAFSLMTA